MKILCREQLSPLWHNLKLGIPSASNFDRVLTPKTGELSKQSINYAHELIAEIMLGYPVKNLDNMYWIDRGKELEPEAVKLYEFTYELSTEPVGFITTDDGRIGASPDRLVGDNGIMEIKCTSDAIHMGYVLSGIDEKYKSQIQGQLLVTGRQWCDWWMYHPYLPPARIRTERDEQFIAKLKKALDGFNDMMDCMIGKLHAAGTFRDSRTQQVTA